MDLLHVMVYIVLDLSLSLNHDLDFVGFVTKLLSVH